MSQLIQLSDVATFKGLSMNINKEKEFNPHVIEAQEFDLRPFMGESFYLEFMDEFDGSPSLGEQKWQNLFNGCRYTYNGKQYEHQGIKAVLVYHSVARYRSEANSIDTPHGIVTKQTPYSDPVSNATVTRLVQQARAGATAHQERVDCFLRRFPLLYPNYDCGKVKKYVGGLRIKRIG